MSSSTSRIGVKQGQYGFHDVSRRGYSADVGKKGHNIKQKGILNSTAAQCVENVIECQLFQRGRCHYGQHCKYAHVDKTDLKFSNQESATVHNRVGFSHHARENGVSTSEVSSRDVSRTLDNGSIYPVRSDAVDCQYYLKTGKCNYGSRCKFNHPFRDENLVNALNRRDCFDFVQKGTCPYGKSCKYNHPESHKPSERREKQTMPRSDSLGSSPRSVSKSSQPMMRGEDNRFTLGDLELSERLMRAHTNGDLDKLTTVSSASRSDTMSSIGVNTSQGTSSNSHILTKQGPQGPSEQVVGTSLGIPSYIGAWATPLEPKLGLGDFLFSSVANMGSVPFSNIPLAERSRATFETADSGKKQVSSERGGFGLEDATVSRTTQGSSSHYPWNELGLSNGFMSSYPLNISEAEFSARQDMERRLHQSTPDLAHNSIWSLEKPLSGPDRSIIPPSLRDQRIPHPRGNHSRKTIYHEPELFGQNGMGFGLHSSTLAQKYEISSSPSLHGGTHQTDRFGNVDSAARAVRFENYPLSTQHSHFVLPDEFLARSSRYPRQTSIDGASSHMEKQYELFGFPKEHRDSQHERLHSNSRVPFQAQAARNMQPVRSGDETHIHDRSQMRLNQTDISSSSMMRQIKLGEGSLGVHDNLGVHDDKPSRSRHVRTFSDPFSSSSVWKPADKSPEFGPGLFGMQHISF